MNPQEFIQCRTGKVIRTRAGYWAFIPNPLPPVLDWSPRLVARLAEAATEVGELAATIRLLPISRVSLKPFLRREVCSSLRIDGLKVHPIDIYLAENSAAASSDPEQATSRVHSGEHAQAFAFESARAAPFSLTGLQATHAQLLTTEEKRGGTPGVLRTSQNWVGPSGSTAETAPFVPPPADRLPGLLSRLETFATDTPGLPPLIRIGLLHYQLEALHPFDTGNGRIGRIVNSALLSAWGNLPYPQLHLSSYFDTHKAEYFDRLLAISRKSAWEAWLTFFLEGIIAEARDTRLRLHRLSDLRDHYCEMISASRAAPRLLSVVDHLLSQPVTDINRAAKALHVNFPVAQRYIQQLEAAGIIREITGQARNRLYCAEGILEAVAT